MPKNNPLTIKETHKSLTVSELISCNDAVDVDELSTNAQTLFGLLTLVIDIKYRTKYGSSLGEQANKRYSKNTMKKVVADQTSPVDNGLLRH